MNRSQCKSTMKNDIYYNIADDIRSDRWCYIVIGGRSTGKTYGALKMCMDLKKKFVFLKRTIDDVKLLCNRGRLSEYNIDLSPFKPINRDTGSNIQAQLISANGIGGFWEHDDANQPIGQPIGYVLALSAVQKFKGFDLSECDYIIFDEFIPQPWERVSKKEGEQVMDLYKTVSRDREIRGREPLKLICLANAVSISNPMCNILEITDIIADMSLKGIDGFTIDGVFIRILQSNDFKQEEEKSIIYKRMAHTSWGRMALSNEFAYDDFSAVGSVNMKGYRCICRIRYKSDHWYVYRKGRKYFITASASTKYKKDYNLNLENDQKLFNIEQRLDIKEACINHDVVFSTYTMYDVIMNYVKYFKI